MTPDPGSPTPARFTTGAERWRAPVRQHRPADPSPLAAWAVTAALLLAVVVTGGWVVGARPTVDERHRPFGIRGAVGEPVSARVFDLTVRRVRTAAELTDRPGWRHDTGGVWIIVLVRAEARREPVSIGHAVVRDSAGRSWSATGRVEQPLADRGHGLQPGIPVEAEIAFEVPRDTATDLVLEVAARSVDLRLEAVAQVPLPLDEAAVAEGLRLTEPVELAPVEVVAGQPVRLEAGPEAGR